jgi:hypothetical protein
MTTERKRWRSGKTGTQTSKLMGTKSKGLQQTFVRALPRVGGESEYGQTRGTPCKRAVLSSSRDIARDPFLDWNAECDKGILVVGSHPRWATRRQIMHLAGHHNVRGTRAETLRAKSTVRPCSRPSAGSSMIGIQRLPPPTPQTDQIHRCRTNCLRT